MSDVSRQTFREAFIRELSERDRVDMSRFLDELEPSPGDLLEEVRSNDEFREELARADAVSFLRTRFTDPDPDNSWRAEGERSGRLGQSSAGTEWSFRGLHDKDDVFNGIRATGRSVVVRGFTIMSLEEEQFKVRRYVDWAGLFGQLGLTVNWRVPLDNPVPS